MKKEYFIVPAIIALLLIGRVVYVQLSKTEIVGEPPVRSLEFREHWITVNPLENTKTEDLVDTSLFYDFVPDLGFDEAKLFFGDPDNIRQENYNTYYEYSFKEARVEVGREEYSTGDGISVDWALYSHPYNKTYSEILAPEISKHIDPTKEKTTVVIKNLEDEIEVLVNIVGTRVDEMILY